MGLGSWIREMFGATLRLETSDVVVFVVGPSGSGKSLFVEEVTRSGLIKIGGKLRPCTTRVQAIRCELTKEAKDALGVATQKNIVFVDTPSFHTGQNNDVEGEISNWLNKSRSISTPVGIIYMHRVETNPDIEPVSKHLNSFVRSFPQDFVSHPRRMRGVLSYEGHLGEDKVWDRKEKFKVQLAKLVQGNSLGWDISYHPNLFERGNPDAAWDAVKGLFSQE